MKLGKYFKDIEFFKTDTYQTILSAGTIPGWLIDSKLIRRLDTIRERFGAVYINRGFSTQAENIIVKGSKWSMHQYGKAADFHVKGIPGIDIYNFILDTWPDGAVGKITDNDLHLDVRNNDTMLIIKY